MQNFAGCCNNLAVNHQDPTVRNAVNDCVKSVVTTDLSARFL